MSEGKIIIEKKSGARGTPLWFYYRTGEKLGLTSLSEPTAAEADYNLRRFWEEASKAMTTPRSRSMAEVEYSAASRQHSADADAQPAAPARDLAADVTSVRAVADFMRSLPRDLGGAARFERINSQGFAQLCQAAGIAAAPFVDAARALLLNPSEERLLRGMGLDAAQIAAIAEAKA
ncbi:MAG TPA: hypothetical protein DCG47_15255 [Spirochaetaceae bacterium]|jgi:hypothetical protein|nr:hypothetical protein [Spirochaetaceae bacterium]